MLDSSGYLKKFGKNIARIRQQNGLTHAGMELYGISRAYYGKIELGKHAITVDKIFLLARAFGVNPSDLFIDENGLPI